MWISNDQTDETASRPSQNSIVTKICVVIHTLINTWKCWTCLQNKNLWSTCSERDCTVVPAHVSENIQQFTAAVHLFRTMKLMTLEQEGCFSESHLQVYGLIWGFLIQETFASVAQLRLLYEKSWYIYILLNNFKIRNQRKFCTAICSNEIIHKIYLYSKKNWQKYSGIEIRKRK